MSVTAPSVVAPALTGDTLAGRACALEALGVGRRYGDAVALRGATLQVTRGEIHALLGPNGAGKTTLMRILAGLVTPNEGEVRIAGCAGVDERRRSVGMVPAGDRSFYLRISGLENLVFFARLHGFRRSAALERSRDVLELVGLRDVAHRRVGAYSHGMQKRLSVARALLCDPPVLLVDEATHDLDPEGAAGVRALVRDAAERGAAVLWATQRLDEIRGFAHTVTVLQRGERRFAGSVAELTERVTPRRHLVQLAEADRPTAHLQAALGSLGRIEASPHGPRGHYVLDLRGQTDLGRAMTALAAAHVRVLAVRQEGSEIEDAFLSLVREERT